jgi:hypothetical protein
MGKWIVSGISSLAIALLFPSILMAQETEANLLNYPDTSLVGIVGAELSSEPTNCFRLCRERTGCAGVDYAPSTRKCRIFMSVSGAHPAHGQAATRNAIPSYHEPLPASTTSTRSQGNDLSTTPMAVSLTWDSKIDLDLSVICPDGKTISNMTPDACEGRLELDANHIQPVDTPVEIIAWRRQHIDGGVYKIVVKHYRGHPEEAPTPFTVTLWIRGTSQVFRGTSIPNAFAEVAKFTLP